MISGWTCFQCEAPNPATARHCSACGAQRPPVMQPLAEADEAPTPVTSTTEPGVGRTDMLSGLSRLVARAASGELSPEAFAERMRSAASGLDQVFHGLAAELYELPGTEEEYARAIETGLEDASALFRMALAELEEFGHGADPARLRVGMLVAEKAEEHYQGLLAGVRADATGQPFSGESDRVRRLAGAVLEGALSLEDYRVRLGEVEHAIRGWLHHGSERLEAGLAIAREFDGLRTEPLNQAAEHLEQAAQDLGKVILAIYDPEVTREAARQILDDAEAEREGGF